MRPGYLDETQNFDIDSLDHPDNHTETLKTLLSSPNISSKRWVFEQYDTMVRTNTVNLPGGTDSGVVRIKGTRKGLAVKTDCNGRYVYLNPRRGGQIAVVEAARNVVCSGAKPLAVTNCLNFGNPYKPEVFWTFKEAVAGMGEACRKLNTPVTGGNVSFYNENPKAAVFPTPVIGMLGLVEDIENHTMTPAFKNSGDLVFYIGADRRGLGGTEYLRLLHGMATGDAPELDLDVELKLQQSLLGAIRNGIVNAVHDISDGGLAVTLAEMALFSTLGAELSVGRLEGSTHEILFSEAQSGVVATVDPKYRDAFLKHFKDDDIPVYKLGKVTNHSKIVIDDYIDLPVDTARSIYEDVIPAAMK